MARTQARRLRRRSPSPTSKRLPCHSICAFGASDAMCWCDMVKHYWQLSTPWRSHNLSHTMDGLQARGGRWRWPPAALLRGRSRFKAATKTAGETFMRVGSGEGILWLGDSA
jgi:hypothetical protein